MKKHITLLLLITPFLSFAQSNWKVGVHFGPTIEYRTLHSKDLNLLVAHRNNRETHLRSFYTGLLVERSLKNNWNIEGGLHYSPRGFNYPDPNELMFEDQINPDGGFIDSSGDTYESYETRANFDYVRLSILSKKYFGQKDLKLLVAAGTTFDYRVTENRSDPTIKFRKFNISPMLQAGLSYQLNEKNSLQSAVHYSIGVIDIVNTHLSAYLWGTGLKLSYFRTL